MKKYFRTILFLTVCSLLFTLQASAIIVRCQECSAFHKTGCPTGYFTVLREHTYLHEGKTETCTYYEVWGTNVGYCMTCGKAAVTGEHLHQIYGHTPRECTAYNENPRCPYPALQ